MGQVLGIATAQAARNVLAAAGVHAAENSSRVPRAPAGRRGARGIRDIGPGTLLVIDEASMMSIPDLLEIVRHAAGRGAKVIIAGDQEQLAAVESGGGMMLLARRLGYVQLAEAVRFTARVGAGRVAAAAHRRHVRAGRIPASTAGSAARTPTGDGRRGPPVCRPLPGGPGHAADDPRPRPGAGKHRGGSATT